MRRLTDSLVDLTVFEPEDLVVYSNIYSASHILITHELRLFVNGEKEKIIYLIIYVYLI